VVPEEYYKTQRHMLQKMHQRELAEKREEKQRDLLFNRIRLMTTVKQTWHENGWPGKRMATAATAVARRRLGSS
jgi:alkyl sulfatase BDS1-like metallo-beta-lactamase superfamily hydrolase